MVDKAGVQSEKTGDVSVPAPVFSGIVSDERALEYLVSVRAAERERIAQQLHNGACQNLALVQLSLGRIKRQGPEDLEPSIVECEELIAQIGRDLRAVCQSDLSSVKFDRRTC
jgi:signal transduction histidine kinase